MKNLEADLYLGMATVSAASVSMLAAHFLESHLLFWIGLALNLVGLWTFHDVWLKTR